MAEGSGVPQSVQRAIRVLGHIAAAAGPVPAKDVARALGLTLPTTCHLLTTLVTGGCPVHLADERAYAVGHRVDDMARRREPRRSPPRRSRAPSRRSRGRSRTAARRRTSPPTAPGRCAGRCGTVMPRRPAPARSRARTRPVRARRRSTAVHRTSAHARLSSAYLLASSPVDRAWRPLRRLREARWSVREFWFGW